ncbi:MULTISPECIES: hypothetical protein [unclassified Streptomyces]|uniref:Uncharacterized protein n=1 Tax=Streptomyces sp. NBC_00060 TaxID=2975636 RepID=A0AAU2GRM8_9ACTN
MATCFAEMLASFGPKDVTVTVGFLHPQREHAKVPARVEALTLRAGCLSSATGSLCLPSCARCLGKRYTACLDDREAGLGRRESPMGARPSPGLGPGRRRVMQAVKMLRYRTDLKTAV